MRASDVELALCTATAARRREVDPQPVHRSRSRVRAPNASERAATHARVEIDAACAANAVADDKDRTLVRRQTRAELERLEAELRHVHRDAEGPQPAEPESKVAGLRGTPEVEEQRGRRASTRHARIIVEEGRF